LALEVYESADENNGPRKVVIWTQFMGVAYAIAQRLGSEALCFVSKVVNSKITEDGLEVDAYFKTADVYERDRIVQKFQNDPDIHFLVATQKAAGVGLTITAAGTHIFNDLFWTPADFEQCMGRSHGRLNDMHGLNAHYLITEETIEIHIMDVIADKKGIINLTVEGVEDSRTEQHIQNELISRIKKDLWLRKS
jgi:SNF2 family DNA or RNA helicase